jgi:hypothetical protein
MTDLNQLKLKVKIANLKIQAGKVRVAAEGDPSTSQSTSSADHHHFVLKKIKRKGFPDNRGTKEKVGMMRLASENSKFAKYYLLDSHDINGNGWGVTEPSIEKNINSFIGMPFVVTAKEWIPDSEYEDQYDHPYVPTNNLKAIFAHQDKFRVADIVKVAKDEDGKWYAMLKRNPKYAHLKLPPFCSPAIYQIDPHEPEGQITKWIGLHLAGLDRDPAYGPRVALFKGECTGPMGACSHQFKMGKLKKAGQEIKPFKPVGQSGLSNTETDKEDSPFGDKKEKKKLKEASCACPQKTNALKSRIAYLKRKQGRKHE